MTLWKVVDTNGILEPLVFRSRIIEPIELAEMIKHLRMVFEAQVGTIQPDSDDFYGYLAFTRLEKCCRYGDVEGASEYGLLFGLKISAETLKSKLAHTMTKNFNSTMDDLRKTRIRKGISSEAMANQLCTSEEILAEYENGNRFPTVDVLMTYAIAVDKVVKFSVENP